MTTYLDSDTRVSFDLPGRLAATQPPEARGLERDGVRMMVARPGGHQHVHFRNLGKMLTAGDVLVVNTSATRAAAVEASRVDGTVVLVHFSTTLDDGTWVVEFRNPDGTGPARDMHAGESVQLPSAMRLHILGAHPEAWELSSSRLWRTRFDGAVEPYLAEHGRPITYGYVRGRWPLSAYQTIFARDQSSAEMPSAARPFSHRLVTELVTRGINFAPIVLHCGVSSLEAGEPPQSERFKVPESTAWLVNETRKAGRRVIAVGTTATRALETVADQDGMVHPGEGWTDLVLGPGHAARTVDGLITGWHQPGASHLSLLEAVAGPDLVQSAYDEALDAEYLWHEFGDSCLLFPEGKG